MTPQELAERRRALGHSQARLAARLGVSTHAIEQWEYGQRRIPPLLDRALRDLEREQQQEGNPVTHAQILQRPEMAAMRRQIQALYQEMHDEGRAAANYRRHADRQHAAHPERGMRDTSQYDEGANNASGAYWRACAEYARAKNAAAYAAGLPPLEFSYTHDGTPIAPGYGPDETPPPA